MTRPRRIAVVTGSRADYGLLRGILTRLKAADDVDLSVVARSGVAEQDASQPAHRQGQRLRQPGEEIDLVLAQLNQNGGIVKIPTLKGFGGLCIQLSGTWIATCQFEGTTPSRSIRTTKATRQVADPNCTSVRASSPA